LRLKRWELKLEGGDDLTNVREGGLSVSVAAALQVEGIRE
jgi:hypothetical protein